MSMICFMSEGERGNEKFLEAEDIREALAYAAWRAEEIEVPLISG